MLTGLLAALLAPGCATTIHRRAAAPIDERIARADGEPVYVEIAEGRIVAVRRDAIEEVEHAGATTAIACGALGGLAASLGVIAHDETEQSQCDAETGADGCKSYTGMAT